MLQSTMIAIAFGVLAGFASDAVNAQERPQVEIGRYQVVVLYNSDAAALLIDTVTGRSWVLGNKKDRSWTDLNYGKVTDGHLVLTPPPCTQDNPTCYFEMPAAKEPGDASP